MGDPIDLWSLKSGSVNEASFVEVNLIAMHCQLNGQGTYYGVPGLPHVCTNYMVVLYL
jgi:hypothetical protein